MGDFILSSSPHHRCAENLSLILVVTFFFLSQVPVTFLPRDRGDYAQFWDLECHPVSEPRQKARIRFQLCGTVRTHLFVLCLEVKHCTESKWLFRTIFFFEVT